ncbi:MAG TPA: alpha/beta hydrolase [Planococcus sp. (in: firmicutes)]|nr:alpha/beta hydrolase [Planococcus sp. (in: firmicutes)]
MPFAQIENDVSLYYHTNGNGLPIVFVHTFIMGHNVFKHQEQLSEKYQTIFFDLRGHGRSSKGNRPVTIELLADDLKKLLDQLGIEQAVLCGYSHGGLIVQEFALKYPERTAAIILSGGYSELNSFTPKFFIKFSMWSAKFKQMAAISKIQAIINRYDKQDEKEIYEYALKTDSQRSYEFCKTGLSYNSTSLLHRLKMPILLVYGSLEKPMHHYMEPFLKEAPQTQVVFIDKGTHQLPPRSFQEFNAILDRFLQPMKSRLTA